jgi:hypothetical protein
MSASRHIASTAANESDSPQALKRSIWRPFWIGCLGGPILFIIFWAELGILRGSFEVFVFGAFAIIIIGPVCGAACQAAHDLVAACRLGLLCVWDFFVFAAIGIALIAAGEALYYGYHKQASVDQILFKNHTFDLAVACVLLMLVVYAMSKSDIDWLSPQTWKGAVMKLWATASESDYSDWPGPQ